MLPLVGFSGLPPEPGVPVTEHRALHKSLRAERMSSCRGGPWRGEGRAPVSVARDAHPAGIEQLPGRRGRPPSAAAVASAEFLPGHSAVLASQTFRRGLPLRRSTHTAPEGRASARGAKRKPAHCIPAHIRQIRAGGADRSTTGSRSRSVLPLALLAVTRTILAVLATVPTSSELLPTLTGAPRIRLLPASTQPLRRPGGGGLPPPLEHQAPRGARVCRRTRGRRGCI